MRQTARKTRPGSRTWNFPQEIDILGHRYEVTKRPYRQYTGWWLSNGKSGNQIRIASRVRAETARKVLLHESIHAIGHHKGLRLPEQAVKDLEHGLDSLLRDNPWIARLYATNKGLMAGAGRGKRKKKKGKKC